MPKKIAVSTLNASTVDILNTIRENAGFEYQTNVPVVTKATDIPRVGEILYGYPALANQFINALVNRIALVRANSATFNNPFAPLKKGYLEFGETIEDVFVEIAKAREFSVEKAEQRELKRSVPDVKSAFYVINFRAQYPVTIQQEQLRQAFLSMDGVQNLIAKIVDSVYRGAEYDEYLLFKYLLIKGANRGAIHRVTIGGNTDNDSAISFRSTSNKFTFISTEYNSAGVHTNTPKTDQYIFMDAAYNAQFDVNVLASAFNMEKADFIGRLILVDDWTTFDNDRFDAIRAASDGIEEVTASELSTMEKCRAILVDAEYFQFYDNLSKMTEKYVASGDYWNYFYNVWKTVAYSPFSNAAMFVTESVEDTEPITFEITDKSTGEGSNILTLVRQLDGGNTANSYNFVGTEATVTAGIAVHPYGACIFPANTDGAQLVIKSDTGKLYGSGTLSATTYTAQKIKGTENVGTTVNFYLMSHFS